MSVSSWGMSWLEGWMGVPSMGNGVSTVRIVFVHFPPSR